MLRLQGDTIKKNEITELNLLVYCSYKHRKFSFSIIHSASAVCDAGDCWYWSPPDTAQDLYN